MSKIFESENQFIIRFPKEVADKINKKIEDQKQDELKIELQPYYENFKNQCEELKFNINVDEKSMKGCMINMPCIVESQKSLDGINFFKSNDITQMILVEDNEQKLQQKLFQQKATSAINSQIKTKRIKKNEIPSGLTAPTKFIKQRYFRRKLNIVQEEIVKIEDQMIQIIADFTKQRDQNQQDSQKRKRRYRRHL